MPSMHLAAAAIYVFAAWRTQWFIPALLFWGIIFIGSGYFGYHYWVDGLAGAGTAAISWLIAQRYYARLPEAASMTAYDLRTDAGPSVG